MTATKLIAPALMAALLMTGCTAGANVSAGAGTTTGTGSTGTGTGATVGAGTNVNVGTASGYYAVGRKWVYDITNVTAGQTQKMTQSWECTSIEGDTATIKFTMTGGPTGESTTTSKVKINQTPTASGALPEGTTITEMGSESVTVAAGTFNAKKFVSTTSDANADTTNNQWVEPTVGLVKMVSTIKPKMAAPVAGFDLTSTMTMELKSFTK